MQWPKRHKKSYVQAIKQIERTSAVEIHESISNSVAESGIASDSFSETIDSALEHSSTTNAIQPYGTLYPSMIPYYPEPAHRSANLYRSAAAHESGATRHSANTEYLHYSGYSQHPSATDPGMAMKSPPFTTDSGDLTKYGLRRLRAEILRMTPNNTDVQDGYGTQFETRSHNGASRIPQPTVTATSTIYMLRCRQILALDQ